MRAVRPTQNGKAFYKQSSTARAIQKSKSQASNIKVEEAKP